MTSTAKTDDMPPEFESWRKWWANYPLLADLDSPHWLYIAVMKVAKDAYDAGGQAAERAATERAAKVAEDEPELEGPMPDCMRGYSVEEIARTAVRITKRNIIKGIRALTSTKEKPDNE